jgi:hypothetical protein
LQWVGSGLSSGLYAPALNNIGLSINSVPQVNWTTVGPVTPVRTAQWVTGALGSAGGATTALTFSTPATTPAALTGFLTYAQGTVNGDTWTTATPGNWAIKAAVNATSAAATTIQIYITNNGSSTTLPSIAALTPSVMVDYTGSVVPTGQTNGLAITGGVYNLPVGSVIRAHTTVNSTAGVTITTAANCFISFTFLGGTNNLV